MQLMRQTPLIVTTEETSCPTRNPESRAEAAAGLRSCSDATGTGNMEQPADGSGSGDLSGIADAEMVGNLMPYYFPNLSQNFFIATAYGFNRLLKNSDFIG